MFRVLLSTCLVGLLLASNIGLALGYGYDGSSGRYDILQGTRGESACTLADDIDQNCTTSSARRDFLLSPIQNRDDGTPLVPSICTCNAIFFNIWSACYYSTGNNTLPDFTQWTQSCTTSSINVDSSTSFSEVPGNLGIDVPPWAKIIVPGNSTFDIQRAVTMAFSTSRHGRWTTLQMILPVVAALVTLLLSGVVLLTYLQYRRKHLRGSSRTNRMEWPIGMKRLHLHTSHKVVTTRNEAWEIDGPVAIQQPFADFDTSFDDLHGQPVPVRTSSYDMEMTEVDKKSKTVSSLKSTTQKASMGTHSFGIPIRSRLPWKRRPPHITLVPATSRFRVDEAKSISRGSDEAVERNEAENVDHVEPEIEETRSLITPSEPAERDSQEVILISKDGRSFTLESTSQNTASINSHHDIKIISPSVSSTSPHSAMHPVSAKPNLLPPPPSHAAPESPVMPQILRPTTEFPSERKREQSFQPPFLSSIREASSSVQSFSSSNTNLRRSPALHRSSNSGSFSSVYIFPAESSNTLTTTTSPSSHRTASSGPDLSRALGSEDDDDFYMENTMNGQQQHYGHFSADSDGSFASFYYNSPVQTPVQRHHANISLPHSTGPSELYAGPVRGLGAGYYSIRKDTQ